MSVEKQYEVLQWAFSFLKEHKREENVAEILLQHHLDVSRAVFFASMREKVSEKIVAQFKQDIVEHVTTGIPVQHLTGEAFFYGRSFRVSKHVLVPRFETEELVHHVIEGVQKTYGDEPVTIVDVGTGSGIIAITLALELPNAFVYATDISEEALQVAKKNAADQAASVDFIHGDFLQPIIEEGISPQIIVSNPPYIKKTDEPSLSDTVKNFDPHLALFAENQGLKAYEEIMDQTIKLTDNLRFIYFEIGFNQAKAITSIIKKQFPTSKICTIQDMNDKDRIIVTKLKM